MLRVQPLGLGELLGVHVVHLLRIGIEVVQLGRPVQAAVVQRPPAVGDRRRGRVIPAVRSR